MVDPCRTQSLSFISNFLRGVRNTFDNAKHLTSIAKFYILVLNYNYNYIFIICTQYITTNYLVKYGFIKLSFTWQYTVLT